MAVFTVFSDGVLLRVRLSPNSSSCKINDVFTDAGGSEYLKISVVSVPEKGKANKELIRFLADKIGVAKSMIKVISGETDRMKKLQITVDSEKFKQWLKKEGLDDAS